MMRKGFSGLTREVRLKCGRQPSSNSLYYTTFFDSVSKICAENSHDPGLKVFGSRMTKRMIFPVNAIIHNIYIHIC